jgi:hypothetical protein
MWGRQAGWDKLSNLVAVGEAWSYIYIYIYIKGGLELKVNSATITAETAPSPLKGETMQKMKASATCPDHGPTTTEHPQ